MPKLMNKPKGVHSSPYGSGSGVSGAGLKLRNSKDKRNSELSYPESRGEHMYVSDAKEMHRGNLSDLRALPKPKLMAEGGSINSLKDRYHQEKGVHRATLSRPGTSYVGHNLELGRSGGEGISKEESESHAKEKHHKMLGEMRSMPKPKLMAEGGEVEHDKSELKDADGDYDGDEDHEVDEEMHGMMGEELMNALDSKDKKRIMESLEAIVLQCLNKE